MTAIGLMILVGAIIIFLDRNQVKQLWGKAEWNYLGVALGFVAVSYPLGSHYVTNLSYISSTIYAFVIMFTVKLAK
jgi:hypothetical protein